MAGVLAKFNKLVTVFGQQYEISDELSADVCPKFQKSVPAAKTGTLTTRTDNDTGELTMTAGHGITTGQRLDVYWTDPTTGEEFVRYGMTVGTVATNAVPIDGGGGDNLPVQDTAVRAMVPQSEDITVVGANVQWLTIYSRQGGTIVYTQSNSTYIHHFQLEPLVLLEFAKSWTTSDGTTNPVTGVTIGKIYLSHGNSAQAVTMYGTIGYN